MHRLIVTAENLNAEEELIKFKEAEANFLTANKEAKQLEVKMKNLKSTAANTPGDGKAKKKAVEVAQTAEGIYLATKEIADKAKEDMDTAKNRYDQVKAEKDSKQCNYYIAMSITPLALEPDTNHPFLLKLNHSPLRDDELKIKTTQSGLLTSTDVTSTDRTGDIAVEIAKAVAMFGVRFPAQALSPKPHVKMPGEDKKEKQPSEEPKKCYSSIMKHDEIVDFSLVAKKLIDITFRDSSGFAVNKDLYLLPPDLKMKIVTPGSAKDLKSIYETDEGLGRASYPLKGHYGILYRRDVTYLANLIKDDTNTIVANQQISMPNLSPVTLVPFEYLSLVTTKNNAAFENGMLISYDTNQPSSALALANLPARVAEGYINALTNFLQLKFNYSSKAIDSISKEKELIDLLKSMQGK